MLKVWERPHPRSFKKLRSAHLVWVSIFQNWTRTFICRRFCKASSGLGTGWHPGLDRLVVNREAPLNEQLPEPMENSGEGQENKVEPVGNLLGKGSANLSIFLKNCFKSRSGLPSRNDDPTKGALWCAPPRPRPLAGLQTTSLVSLSYTPFSAQSALAFSTPNLLRRVYGSDLVTRARSPSPAPSNLLICLGRLLPLGILWHHYVTTARFPPWDYRARVIFCVALLIGHSCSSLCTLC